MTSQQLMMNHLGIALASDSTVTLGSSGRTYPSVNKIFSLSGRQPIAFMVSNAANYIPSGISWERVIGLYRAHLKNEELPRLDDYVSHFMNFVTTEKSLNSPNVNDIAIQSDLISYFTKQIKAAEDKEKLKRETSFSMPDVWKELDLDDYFNISMKKRIEHILLQVREQNEKLSNDENHSDWTNQKYKTSKIHSKNIESAANEFVKRHECEMYFKEICEIFHFHLCRYGSEFNWKTKSTISICGFGKEEMKPTMVSFEVGCDIGNGPFSKIKKYYIRNKKSYSDRGDWIEEEKDIWSTTGFAQGFAQTNNIETLLTGINPYTYRYLMEGLSRKVAVNMFPVLLDVISKVDGVGEATLQKIDERLSNGEYEVFHSIDQTIKDIVRGEWLYHQNRFDTVTSSVPIDELAKFVEIMVGLEVQISHYINDVRSVGGPIDVATVTKEEGFIWVKSKQIHDSKMNPRVSLVTRDNANLM